MNIQAVENANETSALAVEPTSRAAGRQAPAADTKNAAVDKTSGNQELSGQEKEKLLGEVQDYFQSKGVSLHFKMLDSLKEVQVEMVDEKTSKVICKIPEDNLVKLAQNMKKMGKGVMDLAI